MSSLGPTTPPSPFGALLMVCRPRPINVERCATQLFIFITQLCCLQVASLSYHAASGTIVLGLEDGQVGLWQTAPRVITSLQDAQSAHACVRERLAEAQAQVNSIVTGRCGTIDLGVCSLQSVRYRLDRQATVMTMQVPRQPGRSHSLSLSFPLARVVFLCFYWPKKGSYVKGQTATIKRLFPSVTVSKQRSTRQIVDCARK